MIRPRFAFLLVLTLLAWPLAALAEETATVTRLQGGAQAVEAAGVRVLAVGDPVRPGERLRTGPGSRLRLRFVDGMELTLSDGAEMVVDEFASGPRGPAPG